jgi:hypothetical protein
MADDARRELLEEIASAIERLAGALADLGTAYEQLDEQTADRLEDALFRPAQIAYGRAQRTYTGFAQRHRLPAREFAPAVEGTLSHRPGELVERAVDQIVEADEILAELQDSMRPVEVGDAELRAGLSEVRRLIADVPAHARAFVRVLGR